MFAHKWKCNIGLDKDLIVSKCALLCTHKPWPYQGNCSKIKAVTVKYRSNLVQPSDLVLQRDFTEPLFIQRPIIRSLEAATNIYKYIRGLLYSWYWYLRFRLFPRAEKGTFSPLLFAVEQPANNARPLTRKIEVFFAPGFLDTFDPTSSIPRLLYIR